MTTPKKIKKEEALKKAQRLCAMQEKCTHDMELKLKDWGCEPENISFVITKLISEDFISDKRFAQIFVREKFRFNKWGKIKIGYQLKQKGISASDINTAFTEINENDYYNLLYHELTKKFKSQKASSQVEHRQKLYRFASSRGFESEIISMAIDKILVK